MAQPPRSFLSLPAELRTTIYKALLLPGQNHSSTSPSAYSNLRLTCRQIKAEFDHEFVANLPQYTAEIREIITDTLGPDAPITISPMSNFANARTLHVNLPISWLCSLFPPPIREWYKMGHSRITNWLPSHIRIAIFELESDGTDYRANPSVLDRHCLVRGHFSHSLARGFSKATSRNSPSNRVSADGGLERLEVRWAEGSTKKQSTWTRKEEWYIVMGEGHPRPHLATRSKLEHSTTLRE